MRLLEAFVTIPHPQTPLHPCAQRHVGVLLVNLGTPTSPSVWHVANYLREFLSDPRVVHVPRLLWLPLLYGIILPFRSPSSAKKYQRIWQHDSPLRLHGQSLAHKLQQRFNDTTSETKSTVHVQLAMRYGTPSMQKALRTFQQAGCKDIVVLPLFPQFSAVTSASVFDHLATCVKAWSYVPSIRFINTYHDHPLYVHALAQRMRAHWQTHAKNKHLVFSFHGIPKAQWDKGDPYHCFCQKTARLVAEQLNIPTSEYSVCFQSRLGRATWLTPYTEDVLCQLAKQGIHRIDVVSPSFVSDCLETVDEISLEYQELFQAHGGESLTYLPALNSADEAVTMFYHLIRENLYTAPTSYDKLMKEDYHILKHEHGNTQHMAS